jgi:hypothetical protein
VGATASNAAEAGWTPEQVMLARHKEAQDFDDPGLQKVTTTAGPRMVLGNGEPPEKYTAVVQFKRGRLRQYECTAAITCGDYAMVESQSGVDCGLVVLRSKYSWDGTVQVEELEGADALSCKLPLEAGAIRRMATEQETALVISYIPRLEQQALNLFRLRCKAHGYNAALVEDCELQFDGRRVTFFYDADAEHDFREAVREVAMCYNARIWVDNINPAAASRPIQAGGTAGGYGGPRRPQHQHQHPALPTQAQPAGVPPPPPPAYNAAAQR